jgi:hypothetical protein
VKVYRRGECPRVKVYRRGECPRVKVYRRSCAEVAMSTILPIHTAQGHVEDVEGGRFSEEKPDMKLTKKALKWLQ